MGTVSVSASEVQDLIPLLGMQYSLGTQPPYLKDPACFPSWAPAALSCGVSHPLLHCDSRENAGSFWRDELEQDYGYIYVTLGHVHPLQ